MRRSGNHAISNWVLKQLEGATCYNNNMGPFHPPENTIIKRIFLKGWSKYNLVVSLEDKPCEAAFLPFDEKKFGKASIKANILILRDPFNMFASRWVWKDEFGRMFREDKMHQQEIIDLWKDHAQTFLAWRNGQVLNKNEIYIPIQYNQWFKDLEYRKELAHKLGLEFTDKGKEEVSGYGFGSSFEGRENDGKASNSKVMERWEGLKENSSYKSLFQDAELRSLASEIFEMKEAEKALF